MDCVRLQSQLKEKNNKMQRCYMTVPLLKNELLENQRKRKQKSKLKEKKTTKCQGAI
jgi:flagellar biosynthesis chaperone FliJ